MGVRPPSAPVAAYENQAELLREVLSDRSIAFILFSLKTSLSFTNFMD